MLSKRRMVFCTVCRNWFQSAAEANKIIRCPNSIHDQVNDPYSKTHGYITVPIENYDNEVAYVKEESEYWSKRLNDLLMQQPYVMQQKLKGLVPDA